VGDLGGYDMNVYFMYFEARNNPKAAPVGVYLAGGPGEASSYAALNSESGPCVVNHEGTNTTINPWSFNSDVNMLYIDQPMEVGFSFSSLTNGTYNSTSYLVTPNNGTSTPPSPGQGIFSDQSTSTTANSTVASARGLWVFLEHWLSSFPGYETSSKEISFWGNSYGGFYVPEVAATVSKGLKQLPASHRLKNKDLKVYAIGITNGCIDFYYQIEGFPEYANNNTYGVKFYNDTFYQEIQNNITKPGGCLALTEQCRQAGEVGDPHYTGNNATVNQICLDATLYCATIITPLYTIHNVRETDPFLCQAILFMY
jgi:carboxypeptidase C (cathepsin A)